MPTIVQPQDNESPDSTQALTSAVAGNNNTSHGATTSDVSIGSEQSDSETRTCRWFTFVGFSPRTINLTFNWSISGSIVLTGAAPGTTVGNASFLVEYSTNGGSSWTTALSRPFSRNDNGTTPISDSGSVNISLPVAALSQIQVRDRIRADATSAADPTVSATASITAQIDTIQLSVEFSTPQIITMM
jgi:hypothetical protein